MVMYKILSKPQRVSLGSKRRAILWMIVIFIDGISRVAYATDLEPPSGRFIAASRQTELIKIVRQDCGSCHGMTLKGGLGPALLPNSLGAISFESLKAVILFGRPELAMPPWQQFMTEDEAAWIALNLKNGFPNEN